MSREQIIVCAACQCNGLILCSARHWDKLMHKQLEEVNLRREFPYKASRFTQGFIDQYGEFITREAALQLVAKNQQVFDVQRNGSTTELFSEGLY